MDDQSEKLSDKIACVVDNGLFIDLAIRLSQDFGKVYYFSEWRNSFPSKKLAMVGAGLEDEGVERIESVFEYIDEVDIWIFPDVYDGDLQHHLRSLGKRVFGGAYGDELELYRDEAKKLFKSLNIPVQPYKVIVGLDNLREYLKQVTNKWIKISVYRGDGETWHHEKYSLSEPMLDALESRLGAMKYDYEFIVEDSIDGDDVVETGYDGISVDGKYISKCITGYEIKDCGYIGTVKDYKDVSPLITDYNTKIAPVLERYQYRGFMSTEIRVGEDRVPYMIDACQRCGSPPNELYQEMFDNLGEILWNAAEGVLVEPKFRAKYGIEVIIHSDWASDNWQAIDFPEEIRRWVKLRNVCKIKDRYYIVPQADGMPEIGAVVAIGDSVEEVVKKVKGYCEKIEGYRIDLKMESIDKAVEATKSGEKLGIKF